MVCVNTSMEVSTDDGCRGIRTWGAGASGLGSDQPVTAREAVEKVVQAGMLDALMNQVDSGDLQLTGDGGFLPELVRRVLEAGLAAELTDHLGYERHDRAGHGSGNSRNGFTAKRLGPRSATLTWRRRGIGWAALSRGWCRRGNAGSVGCRT